MGLSSRLERVMKWVEVSDLLERRSWLLSGWLRRPDPAFADGCSARCLVAELKDLFLQHVGPEERRKPVWY